MWWKTGQFNAYSVRSITNIIGYNGATYFKCHCSVGDMPVSISLSVFLGVRIKNSMTLLLLSDFHLLKISHLRDYVSEIFVLFYIYIQHQTTDKFVEIIRL